MCNPHPDADQQRPAGKNRARRARGCSGGMRARLRTGGIGHAFSNGTEHTKPTFTGFTMNQANIYVDFYSSRAGTTALVVNKKPPTLSDQATQEAGLKSVPSAGFPNFHNETYSYRVFGVPH